MAALVNLNIQATLNATTFITFKATINLHVIQITLNYFCSHLNNITFYNNISSQMLSLIENKLIHHF